MKKRYKIKRIYASPLVTYLVMGGVSLFGLYFIAVTYHDSKNILDILLHYEQFGWGLLIAISPIAYLAWTRLKAKKEDVELWKRKYIYLDIAEADEAYNVFEPTNGVYKNLRFSSTGELQYINSPFPYCLRFESAPDPIIFFENIKELKEKRNPKKLTIIYLMYKAKLEEEEEERIIRGTPVEQDRKVSVLDMPKFYGGVNTLIDIIKSKMEAPEEEIFQNKLVFSIEKTLTIEFKTENEKKKFLAFVNNNILPYLHEEKVEE